MTIVKMLTAALSITALLSTAAHVCAQDQYPSHAIKIVVPTAPGPVPDALARIIGERLSAKWGRPVVVENRPGATGNVGAEFVAKANPDGYTLLSSFPGPLAVNQSLYGKLNFDPAAFVPVTVFGTAPNVLVVHPSVPASNLKELVAYAERNPDQLTYASPGIGGGPHLAMELLKKATGTQIRHIPYSKGLASALIDVLAGRVEVIFANFADILPHIRSGELRPIAVGNDRRLPELPEIPAIAETYPGFEVTSWYALVAPPDTPAVIVAKLSDAVAEALKQPKIAASLHELGLTPVGGSPATTAAYIKAETQRWHDVIVTAGIKAD
jgi:tripartite-type tricarboxylate transporter receptor subunit TctC